MVRSLSTYARECQADRESLASARDCPILLWEAGLCVPEPGAEMAKTATGAGTFNPNPGSPLVIQVRPESTRSEVAGISVGRSETNDVVLQNPSVSRLHALIHRDARSTEWRITDAGGRNGTTVDGVLLKKEQSVALKDGSTVRLGDVVLRFLMPDSFLRELDARAADLPPGG